MNLAPSWAAKARQWWDELVTGRHERTLKEQVSELQNQLYAARAKCEQMEKQLMLANPLGARYVASTQPPREQKSIPFVPQSWADIQAVSEIQDAKPGT